MTALESTTHAHNLRSGSNQTVSFAFSLKCSQVQVLLQMLMSNPNLYTQNIMPNNVPPPELICRYGQQVSSFQDNDTCSSDFFLNGLGKCVPVLMIWMYQSSPQSFLCFSVASEKLIVHQPAMFEMYFSTGPVFPRTTPHCCVDFNIFGEGK